MIALVQRFLVGWVGCHGPSWVDLFFFVFFLIFFKYLTCIHFFVLRSSAFCFSQICPGLEPCTPYLYMSA